MLKMIAAAAALAVSLAMPAHAASFSADQKDEVEAIVKDYLLEHPEVIRDALVELEKKRVVEEAALRKGNITKQSALLFNSKRQVTLGNPKGDVTLVEFFDYNCGYCKRAHADMMRLIKEDPKLKVVLKEFPVLGEGSVQAAQVAVLVNELAPQKYSAFHDALINSRGVADGPRALRAARDIGLDPDTIKGKLQDKDVSATLNEVYGLANQLGITGTPSYVIQDEVVVGAIGYGALKEKIAAVRACGSTKC